MTRSDVTPDTPLLLETAARLAFPDGTVSIAEILRAIKERRLTVERIGGRTYTTIAWLRAMPRPVKVPAPARKGGLIYVAGFGPYVKIGYMARDIDRRLDALRTGAPEPLVVYGALAGTTYDERILHGRFAAYRLQGEWFRNAGEVAAWIEEGCPL